MDKSVLIEFTGIGGVGKSTIIKECIGILDEKNIRYKDLTVFLEPKFNIKTILVFVKSLILTLKFKPKNISSGIKVFKSLAVYFILYNRRDKNKLNLFDEGIFHRIRAMRRHCRNLDMNKALLEIFKNTNIPDILVVVESDSKTIYERRINRNRSNDRFSFASIKEEQNDTELDNTLLAFNKDKNELGQHVMVYKVQNNKDSDIREIAFEIVDLVVRLDSP